MGYDVIYGIKHRIITNKLLLMTIRVKLKVYVTNRQVESVIRFRD